MTVTRSTPGRAAEIRRYYERRMAPLCQTARVRRDILALLEERKSIARAAEALLHAALPYSGDPALARAVEDLRAVLEGRAPSPG